MLIPLRVQSPSSIKTYKQCPRKYYYQYIAKLPTTPNIHQVRGNIVHDALESFFKTPVEGIDGSYKQNLNIIMQDLLLASWRERSQEISSLRLPEKQIMSYFEESMSMLNNWLSQLISKIESLNLPFNEAWAKLLPLEMEKEYTSPSLGIRGFIDVVERRDNETRVMDYKTDKDGDIEKHILQLAIYSLLFKERHGKLPDKAGIYFLKGKESHIKVDEELVAFAKKEVEQIHQKTQNSDKKEYPKHITGLCKWSTGQCDFYDTCFSED